MQAAISDALSNIANNQSVEMHSTFGHAYVEIQHEDGDAILAVNDQQGQVLCCTYENGHPMNGNTAVGYEPLTRAFHKAMAIRAKLL